MQFTVGFQRMLPSFLVVTVNLWIASPQSASQSPAAPPQGVRLEAQAGHVIAVNAIALSRNEQLAVTGSDDQTAKLWDIKTRLQLRVFNARTFVEAVAFSSDGKSVLTAQLGYAESQVQQLSLDGTQSRAGRSAGDRFGNDGKAIQIPALFDFSKSDMLRVQ